MKTKEEIQELMMKEIFIKTGGRPENPRIAEICAEIAMEEYASQKESTPAQWISVEERLPENNIGVLVYIPDEDYHITSGMLDRETWVLLDEYRVPECEVTHWMPLPKAPSK